MIVAVASLALTIYIDRPMAKKRTKIPGKRQRVLSSGRKRVLVVLFIPSVERDGTSAIDQALWVDSALEMFGRVFGGATAFPKAKGIWRDDERGGTLVQDEPIVVHCTQRPSISRMIATSPRLVTIAGSWAARPARVRSAWWWATSISPSAISPKE